MDDPWQWGWTLWIIARRSGEVETKCFDWLLRSFFWWLLKVASHSKKLQRATLRNGVCKKIYPFFMPPYAGQDVIEWTFQRNKDAFNAYLNKLVILHISCTKKLRSGRELSSSFLLSIYSTHDVNVASNRLFSNLGHRFPYGDVTTEKHRQNKKWGCFMVVLLSSISVLNQKLPLPEPTPKAFEILKHVDFVHGNLSYEK